MPTAGTFLPLPRNFTVQMEAKTREQLDYARAVILTGGTKVGKVSWRPRKYIRK